MKEKTLNWMITQIFLSDTGVHEVHVNNNSHKLRCNCPGFETRASCKHTRFVQTKMDKNGGIYPVEVSNRVDKDQSLQKCISGKPYGRSQRKGFCHIQKL